jgi:hypothetical protein
MSELVGAPFSKGDFLLKKVKGLELVSLDRTDECCGFGGTFCVVEEAVSVKMGKDRVADHEKNNVQIITGGDMSCLMHLEGVLRRKKSSIQIRHIAEILNSELRVVSGPCTMVDSLLQSSRSIRFFEKCNKIKFRVNPSFFPGVGSKEYVINNTNTPGTICHLQ